MSLIDLIPGNELAVSPLGSTQVWKLGLSEFHEQGVNPPPLAIPISGTFFISPPLL